MGAKLTQWSHRMRAFRSRCHTWGRAITVLHAVKREENYFPHPSHFCFVQLARTHAHTHACMHAHCVLLSHHCNLTSGLLPQDRNRQIHAFTYILWQCAAHITSHPVTLTLPLGSFIYLFNKREGWEEVSVPERKLDRRYLRGRRRSEKRERIRLIWEH